MCAHEKVDEGVTYGYDFVSHKLHIHRVIVGKRLLLTNQIRHAKIKLQSVS